MLPWQGSYYNELCGTRQAVEMKQAQSVPACTTHQGPHVAQGLESLEHAYALLCFVCTVG